MKKIFTILLLFVCFVSVPSCQKDSNGKGDDPNRLSAKEAKEYFEQNSTCLRFLSVGGDKPSGTKSALTENMIIDWDSAIESETTDAYFVEVPINMASPITAVTYKGIGNLKKDIKSVLLRTSLLIEKCKVDNCINSNFIVLLGTFSVNNKQERYPFLCEKSKFIGYMMKGTTDGNLQSCYFLNQGKASSVSLISDKLFMTRDSLGHDKVFTGISLISSKKFLTKGGGGSNSGEQNVCPICGAVNYINWINGDLAECTVCQSIFWGAIDFNGDYCSICGNPVYSCMCCSDCHTYPCICGPATLCPYCERAGCGGECQNNNNQNIQFFVRLIPTPNGTISITPNCMYHDMDSFVTVQAFPDEGYSFDYWLLNGQIASVDNPYVFVVSDATYVKAIFVENSN